MPTINIGLIFKPKSQPAKLTALLSDFKPRTALQIRDEIGVLNLTVISRRANESLKPHKLKIQPQLDPIQKVWQWFLIETGGRSYAI